MNLSIDLKEKYTRLIKTKAKQLGFSFCGISKSEFLEEEAPRLDSYLKKKFHGNMKYLENNAEKSLDPQKLVEGSKSVISLMTNYFPKEKIPEENNYIISKYIYGKDYHIVIKNKLSELSEFICKNIGQVNLRTFVDSAPVLEKAWAAKSGLGFIGKNSILINPNHGSFFFLSEIITDLELFYDKPLDNYFCGNCTKCIDACPTKAIVSPKVINPNLCISYLTKEFKENLPDFLKGKLNNIIIGCDICQDVCPFNKLSKPHKEVSFLPSLELLKMRKSDWENITEKEFKKLFKNTAVERMKFKNLKRNIEFNCLD